MKYLLAAAALAACGAPAKPAAPTTATAAAPPTTATTTPTTATTTPTTPDPAAIAALEGELRRGTAAEAGRRRSALSDGDLAGLAALASCREAMAAAAVLVTRGDPRWLPRRGADASAAAVGRALCLVAADDDPTRRRDLLRDYLPARSGVAWNVEHCAGDHADAPDGGWVERTLDRAHATGDELGRFGALGFEGCVAAAAGTWTCDGVGAGHRTTVTLAPGEGGLLYLRAIDSALLTGCD